MLKYQSAPPVPILSLSKTGCDPLWWLAMSSADAKRICRHQGRGGAWGQKWLVQLKANYCGPWPIWTNDNGTAVSEIPKGCVLVSPQNALFFTFSDRLLTISHAMYLVSNKVTSNRTKITVFLHISYIYLRTCHPSSPKFELLKIIPPRTWKKVSKTW